MDEKILTVAQVNNYIKGIFDMDYILRRLFVQGEVSNCKLHSSGHIYFTLKDSYSSISCVLFKGNQQNSNIILRDGLKIIAQGSASVYEKTGQYQIYVKEIIEDGIGLLYQRFEALKKKLAALGWFDEDNKKKLPLYPKKVGIITSRTGAVIQDIMNVAKRRNPTIQLVLYPTLVQGDQAKYSIVEGIHYLDQMPDIDVIILARGGGSIEDLWPFNEELVAEAIFHANKPIVSAIGHETDFTIADFVSDLRAPTPSAAAELVIPSLSEMEEVLNYYRVQLMQKIKSLLSQSKSHNKLLETKLLYYHPRRNIEQKMLYLNDLQNSLENSIQMKIREVRHQLLVYNERLNGLSVMKRLESGYAYIMDENGQKVTSIQQLLIGQKVQLVLTDGQIQANIQKITVEKRVNDGST